MHERFTRLEQLLREELVSTTLLADLAYEFKSAAQNASPHSWCFALYHCSLRVLMDTNLCRSQELHSESLLKAYFAAILAVLQEMKDGQVLQIVDKVNESVRVFYELLLAAA